MRSFQREAVLVSAIAVASIAVASLTAQAQQPPKAGCRVVSKLEYDTAKGERDYQPGRQILPDRTTLATPLLALSCMIWGGQQWGGG